MKNCKAPNEELQTAKEEIQATQRKNSAPSTMSLYRRNTETARISDDFQNLLSSIHIPITNAGGGSAHLAALPPPPPPLFNLIASDIGRPPGQH